MKKTLLKGVLFDFDGVLCNDYFYNTLEKSNPKLYNDINLKIFKGDKPLIRKWMRGELTSDDINHIISDRLNQPFLLLKEALEKSIPRMKLNRQLFQLINKLKKKDVKVAILTDNMDVFTKLLVPHNHLERHFDNIFSSFEYRKLKADSDGEFIKEALSIMHLKPKNSLIIDDWDEIGNICARIGGHFFLYKNNFKELKNWLNINFSY